MVEDPGHILDHKKFRAQDFNDPCKFFEQVVSWVVDEFSSYAARDGESLAGRPAYDGIHFPSFRQIQDFLFGQIFDIFF